MVHIWHDIPVGEKAPEIVNCVIEIPQGTRAKYEIDKETGLLRLDRVLSSPMHYPTNYGFIPKTYCDDGDALDVVVISQVVLDPLCIVDVMPIGVMHMIDGGEADDKIIAIASNDPGVKHIRELSDMPEQHLKEIKTFFEDYKKLCGKTVEVSSFEDKTTAHKIIQQSIQDYQDKFK